MFTNKNGFRKCFRKVKSMGHSVVESADPICKELLAEASTFVMAAPRADFTDAELADLTSFLENCGNILVLAHEGGLKSNLNKLLNSYGIEVNEDALLRTVYYKFVHPKEVLITSGVKSKVFQKLAEKLQEQKKGKKKRAAKVSFVKCRMQVEVGMRKWLKDGPELRKALLRLDDAVMTLPLVKKFLALNRGKQNDPNLGGEAKFPDVAMMNKLDAVSLLLLL